MLDPCWESRMSNDLDYTETNASMRNKVYFKALLSHNTNLQTKLYPQKNLSKNLQTTKSVERLRNKMANKNMLTPFYNCEHLKMYFAPFLTAVNQGGRTEKAESSRPFSILMKTVKFLLLTFSR